MSESKLRGAVYGCGMISEFHLRGWLRIPEVEIVALGDRALERAGERRARFVPSARVYAELETLLESEHLDFIDILTPPALHRAHCLAAKAANLHLICQKPLCDTADDARRLVDEMRDYPKLFAVHENHRYRPWFTRLVEWRRQGFFGQAHLLRLEHHTNTTPGEAHKLAAHQGIMLEYGTHLVDMMRALLGEPRRVYARAHHLNPAVSGESLVHAVYEYPETTAIVEVAWKGSGLPQGRALLRGERGEALYEGSMTRDASARFRVLQENAVVTDEARSPYEDYVESFFLFERECADAMLNGSPITQTGEENLKTLLATFAAYDSIRSGSLVELDRL